MTHTHAHTQFQVLMPLNSPTCSHVCHTHTCAHTHAPTYTLIHNCMPSHSRICIPHTGLVTLTRVYTTCTHTHPQTHSHPHAHAGSQHMHTHAHTHAHGHTLTLRVIMTSCSDVSLLGAKTWERSSYLPHLYHPREKGLLWARPALREHSPCSRLKDVPLRTGQDFSSQGETLSFTRCKLSAALAGRHG